MFPLFTMQVILKIYQQQYCHADYRRCARFVSMQSGVRPAVNLLPDGTDLPVVK